jgi:hypothetical protein
MYLINGQWAMEMLRTRENWRLEKRPQSRREAGVAAGRREAVALSAVATSGRSGATEDQSRRTAGLPPQPRVGSQGGAVVARADLLLHIVP